MDETQTQDVPLITPEGETTNQTTEVSTSGLDRIGGTFEGGVQLRPAPEVNEVSATDLQATSGTFTPAPEPVPSGGADLLAGATGASAELSIDEQARLAAESLAPKTAGLADEQSGIKSRLQEALTKFGTKGASLVEEEERLGVDQISQDLGDVRKDIAAERVAFREAEEALRKDPSLQRDVAQDRLAALKAESNRKLANLAIIESALGGNLERAQAQAKRKIDLEFEQVEAEIDQLQFFYNENKEQLNKEEDRQFQTLINERTRLLNDQKAEKEAVSSLAIDALQNGAPKELVQQMLEADTRSEAIGLGGQFVGALQRQKALLDLTKSELELTQIQEALANPELAKAANLKPLSGDAAKTLGATSTLVLDIDFVKDYIRENGVKGATVRTLMKKDREFARVVNNAIDKLGRMRSGGAINKDEFKSFKKLILSSGDLIGNQEEVLSGLDTIRRDSNAIADFMDPTGGYRSLAGVSPGFELDDDAFLTQGLGDSAQASNEDFFAGF